MDEAEQEALYRDAPEMASYVCRRCGRCMPNETGLDIPEIFRLEGYYDRQMMPGPVMDLPDAELREGLNNWFQNRDYARRLYAELDAQVTEDTDVTGVESRCPYNLPINKKIHWVHRKLTGN